MREDWDDLKTMAYYLMSMIEGDDHLLEDAMEHMRKCGFIDEHDEWIYEDDEEE